MKRYTVIDLKTGKVLAEAQPVRIIAELLEIEPDSFRTAVFRLKHKMYQPRKYYIEEA